MKTLYKLGLSLSVILLNTSCSENKNSLTEANILKYLKDYEIKQPIVFKTIMSPTFIKSVEELEKANTSYSKLYKDGYLKTILRTDIQNPETSYRPYQILLTDKAKPFILHERENGVIEIITIINNVITVKDIRILSDNKAEVDVVYKKTKTPFYSGNEIDISQSGKRYPKDTFIKTLKFRKNPATKEWRYPIKITL